MQTLTEVALEKATAGVFTRSEVACWLGGTDERQYSLLKRALKADEVVLLRRGLYCLANKYLRRKPNPFVLAQRVYGPSYVSLESALSQHGWIPEAAYVVTSASLNRSREFNTPVGIFSFARVPQATLYADVQRLEDGDAGSYFLASPLKALADYVYVHACDWESARPLVESLRVEESSLNAITRPSIDRLTGNCNSRRVRRFLEGLGKDLGL